MVCANRYLSICCLLVIGLFFSTGVSAQQETCPLIELDLDSIRRIEWDERNKDSIRVMIGSYYASPYLSTWLTWNFTTNELTETTLEGTAEAIQLANDLNLSNEFFGYVDNTHLEVNTELSRAIYVDPSSRNNTAILVDLDTNTLSSLGSGISGTRADVLWYSDSEFIVVIEPIYGTGYSIRHFCSGKTCPIEDISYLSETLLGKPALNIEKGQIALIDEAERHSVKIYDLEKQSFVLNKEVDFLLYPGLAPIWSADGESIYLIGIHTPYLGVYQLDLGSGKVTSLDSFQEDWDLVEDWLIVPEKEMVVFLTPQVQVICY